MSKSDTKVIYMRKSVNQALNKIWEYPLTVVEAPMGYGKTTAVKEYLKESHAEILWQTLLDNSAIFFWNGFSRLFKKINPAATVSLAGMGVPCNSVFLEEAIRIVADINFSKRTVIVFDDYHLLLAEDIDRYIELLVKSEILNLHIVILSRSVFGENTAELILKGYCHAIEKSCFELSRDEIIEYCKMCGAKLNKEETDFLVSYTEGWISAVYLCLLGFQQDGRIERQASLYELIEKVVYRRIPPEAQEFLVNICIFENFSLEQAEYMWHKENIEALLYQLMADNAFIRYDPAIRMYSMHNIFTSYLRRIFDRQGLDRKQSIWRMAGRWYVSVGDCIHALEYFYKAADFDELLTAIEIDRGNGIRNEHKEKLNRYFSDCPTEIKIEHLQACLIYAINLFSFNEMELFAQQCAEIGGYIETLPEKEEQEKNQLTGELELLCSFAKYNHIAGMFEHIQRADNLLTKPSEFMDRNSSWTFGSPSVLYMFYRESGKLEQAVHEMNVAIQHYCRLTAGHGSGAEAVMEAERYYYMGDFENAEITAHKALYCSRSQDQTAIVLCAQFLQLRLAVVKGDSGYMMSCLQQTREEIKGQGLYMYLHTWDMCEGFVYSYLKQEKKIPAWIVNGDLQERAIYFPSYAFFNIVWGKMLLISGQYLKLIGLAQTFIDIASVFPNLLGQMYTYIFEAAAKFKLGHREDARVTLKKALDIAAPDQVVMPFVENGEYIADMLTELQNLGHYPELIGRIRSIFPAVEKNREMMVAKLSSGESKLPLTDREWTIVELVVTGLSNRAIGKTLYIAEVTVKKALQNIYAKLGISSRMALAKIIIEYKDG